MITSNRSKISPFYAIEIFEKGQVFKSKNGVVRNLALGEPSANLPKNLLINLKKKLKNKSLVILSLLEL